MCVQLLLVLASEPHSLAMRLQVQIMVHCGMHAQNGMKGTCTYIHIIQHMHKEGYRHSIIAMSFNEETT